MKKTILTLAVLIFASTYLMAQSKAGKADTAQHTAYYTCPMHPDVVSHEAGKCPKCGMALALAGKEQMKAKETKTYNCPVHLDVVSHDPGKCPKCGRKLNVSPKEEMKIKLAKIYTCPMHPEVALDKDGVCPKCGKNLVEKKKSK